MNGTILDPLDRPQALAEPWNDEAWLRTVTLLNLTSLASQIGQFGVGFAMVPLWMIEHGAPAWDVGLITSALWFGMLGGLLATPLLLRWATPRRLVLLGIVGSAAAAAAMAGTHWSGWSVPALVFGFGLGLRWIANETWLYSLCPPGAKGRVVGIHETLIGIAAFVGPALLAASGMRSVAPFAVAAGFCVLAALPLAFAQLGNHAAAPAGRRAAGATRRLARWLPFLALAPMVAGFGGLIENALYALLPVYTAGAAYDARASAWLLTAFGCGGMALQYPVGLWADRHGVRRCAAGCTLALALVAVLVGSLELPGLALAAALLLMGGLTSAYLTLGTVAATDTDDAAQLALRVSRLSIVFTLLSALGPLVSGAVTGAHGSASLPWLVAGMAAVLGGGLALAGRRAG